MSNFIVWAVFFMKLKKWEIALLLALCISLFIGVLGEPDCCAWWGTVYPELTGTAGTFVPASTGAGQGIVLRSRIAEWIAAWIAGVR